MRLRSILPALVLCVSAVSSAQVVLNQVDDFQAGHNHNWGGGSNPVNIATGGPAGAGDRYMRISSSGSNLATYNVFQWSGHYPAAGVDRIEVDLKNTGSNPLVIRLVLFSHSGARWSSLNSVSLPVGSSWTHATFAIAQSNFQQTLGTGSWNDLITDVERMMFRHEPVISSGGTAVVGQLGIDNISAFEAMSTSFTELFTINVGIFGSGSLSELTEPDNNYLFIRQNPARARLDPAVSLTFEATAAPGGFAMMHFELETNTTAVPAASVTQITEFYNFQTNQWEVMDTRPASSSDQFTEAISLSPANYIDPVTRKMRARVRFMDPGTLLTRSWGVNFDLARWVLMR
jgi:hypothetical protein